ncbi:hypothetical protein V2J09_013551 [Rumex salicifolius]
MIRTVVYQGDNLLGDVEIYPQHQQNNNLNSNPDLNGSKAAAVLDHLIREKRIRVNHFSQPSERCPPLAVLYTIGTADLCLKMESNDYDRHTKTTPLGALHSTCLRENKTAVMMLGEEELHLVAMDSRRNDGRPCFWGFLVMAGLYNSCLVMLNLRCLGIVFDLDETLVVANTMRSFEDRIDSLQRKINIETDQQRIAGMVAEIKRYQDDKAILKQYIESDQVIDNGEVIKVQSEFVPALSDNHQPIVRPLIRLQDKNIVLTRINPMIRDTSVLVRLRPAWEELRSYLTARGRKRFEVYVCTMAERDYALEMWRLLDPDSNLISVNELLDRVVCVKSGNKKSLFNVFHKRSCHPKMALVIDDRLKVWDERDQPRVHVVPAFAPYYAPQAEANNAIPVLCVARNVACNVRGGFFKEFDDGLLPLVSEVVYEDDIKDIPPPPDVSKYLVPEDDTSVANGNREPTCFDGMADAEVERRMKEAITSSAVPSPIASLSANPDPRAALHFPAVVSAMPVAQPVQQGSIGPFPPTQLPQVAQLARPLGLLGNTEPSLQASPAREEGEVPESELDPDTRRRLLILQHGQAPNPGPGLGPVPIPVTSPSPPPPPPTGPPRLQSRRGWFEDQMTSGQPGRTVTKEFSSDGLHVEKQRPLPPPFSKKTDNFVRSERPFPQKQRFSREGNRRDDNFRLFKSFQGEDVSLGRSSSSNKDFESESGRSYSSNKDWDSDSGRSSNYRDSDNETGQNVSSSEMPAGALRDIARKFGAKVEYRSSIAASADLRFLMEVYFAGERVGEGKGKTRREAQHYAAEASLMNLADRYLSHMKSESSPKRGDVSRMTGANDGFFCDSNSFGNQLRHSEEPRRLSEPVEAAGSHDGDGGSQDLTSEGGLKSMTSVSALKELCMAEGFGLDFKIERPHSADSLHKDEVYAQVEIDGQAFSRGTGLTWDEAKVQAAEKALANLNSMLGYSNQKRPVSPRCVFSCSYPCSK